MSNGLVESVNTRIRLITSMVFGFRSLEALIVWRSSISAATARSCPGDDRGSVRRANFCWHSPAGDRTRSGPVVVIGGRRAVELLLPGAILVRSPPPQREGGAGRRGSQMGRHPVSWLTTLCDRCRPRGGGYCGGVAHGIGSPRAGWPAGRRAYLRDTSSPIEHGRLQVWSGVREETRFHFGQSQNRRNQRAPSSPRRGRTLSICSVKFHRQVWSERFARLLSSVPIQMKSHQRAINEGAAINATHAS